MITFPEFSDEEDMGYDMHSSSEYDSDYEIDIPKILVQKQETQEIKKTDAEIQKEKEELFAVKSRLSWADKPYTTPVVRQQLFDINYPDLASSVKPKKKNNDGWITVDNRHKSKKTPTPAPVPDNTKTRLCKNTVGECPHGKRCRYAHGVSELNILDCTFDSCRFVRLFNGEYVNTSHNRRCERRHKNETNNNFFKRTGIKDPVTDQEIQDVFDAYMAKHQLLTEEMIEQIEKHPCDKFIEFNGIYYYGRGTPTEPSAPIKKQKYKPRPYNNTTTRRYFDKRKTNETKKTIIVHTNNESHEDPEKVYIRKRNQKNDEIRAMKIAITRTQDTIERFKTINNFTQVKKQEQEYQTKMKKLVVLEEEYAGIKIEKNIPSVKQPVVATEILPSSFITPDKQIKEEMKILEIIVPRKNRDEEERKRKEEADERQREAEEKKKQEEERKRQDEEDEEIKRQEEAERKKRHEGWIRVERKPIVIKQPVKPSPPPQAQQQTYKSQMCRSVSMRTKCPHGERCRFAHNINELLANVKNCGYGRNCKLVSYVSGDYRNTNNYKCCSYKHPEETKMSYITRNKY